MVDHYADRAITYNYQKAIVSKKADARRKIIAEPKEIAVEEGRTND